MGDIILECLYYKELEINDITIELVSIFNRYQDVKNGGAKEDGFCFLKLS